LPSHNRDFAHPWGTLQLAHPSEARTAFDLLSTPLQLTNFDNSYFLFSSLRSLGALRVSAVNLHPPETPLAP